MTTPAMTDIPLPDTTIPFATPLSELLVLPNAAAMTHILIFPERCAVPETTIPLSWSATLLEELLALPNPAAMAHNKIRFDDLILLLLLLMRIILGFAFVTSDRPSVCL